MSSGVKSGRRATTTVNNKNVEIPEDSPKKTFAAPLRASSRRKKVPVNTDINEGVQNEGGELAPSGIKLAKIESEADHFRKLHLDELEKRRNLQRDLMIERDRNKQLQLQVQENKLEIAKLHEVVGSLKTCLANAVTNSKNDQGYGFRKTFPIKNENAFLVNIPCNGDYTSEGQASYLPPLTYQQSSSQPMINKRNNHEESYTNQRANQLPFNYNAQSYNSYDESSFH